MNIRKHITPWLLAITIAASCALAPACIPGGAVDWPALVACGPTIDELIPTVSTIIMDEGQPGETLTDQAMRELEGLAVEHGPEAVACLVQQVVKAFMSQDAARVADGFAADPGRAAAARRGEAFLASKGTVVR